MLGHEAISEAPISSLADEAPPPDPDLIVRGLQFIRGTRARHRARVFDLDGALFHTGQVGAPPEDSMPNREGQFVKGVRARHRSRIVTTRNFHTGSTAPPNPGLLETEFVKGVRARHRSRIYVSEPFHVPISVQTIPHVFVKGTRARHRSRVYDLSPHMIDWGRRTTQVRGLYRVFGAFEYRFFRTLGSPPLITDVPFASNATLPHEPTALYADGEWYLSLELDNGVIKSGFFPIGPNGESWLRLSLVGGAVAGAPPQGPLSVVLELRPAGVVRVLALYDEAAALRADSFVVSATFDGSVPPEDPGAPAGVVAIAGSGLAFLVFDLPAQADGTLVRVRVQTRRTDTGPVDVWSEGSGIVDANADALGPSAPTGGTAWRGSLPAEE